MYNKKNFILTFPLFCNVVAAQESTLQTLQNKYHASPQEICKKAACKNQEDCFNLHVQSLGFSPNFTPKTIAEKISFDEKILKQEEAALSNYWFWSADPQKLQAIQSCLAYAAEKRKFLDESCKIIKNAQEISDTYTNIPGDEKKLQAWVTSNYYAHDYPLEQHARNCRQALTTIDDFLHNHAYDFPTLTQKLQPMRQTILNSFVAIADKAEKERLVQEQACRADADIAHKQSTLQIEREKNQLEQNKVEALQKMYQTLRSINQHNINGLEEKSLQQIEWSIRQLQDEASRLQITHRQLQYDRDVCTSKIAQARKYQEDHAKLEQLYAHNHKQRQSNSLLIQEITQLSSQLEKIHKPTNRDVSELEEFLQNHRQESANLSAQHGQLARQNQELQDRKKQVAQYQSDLQTKLDLAKSIEQKIKDIQDLSKNQAPKHQEAAKLHELDKKLQSLELYRQNCRTAIAALLESRAAANKNDDQEKK
jgi:hypothetical protein